MNKLVHMDIQSTDLEKSKAFYSELFGWRMKQWSPDYALFEYPDGSGGGGGFLGRFRDCCGCLMGIWSKQ